MNYLRIVICALVCCIQVAKTNAADQDVNEIWQKLISPSLSDQKKRDILDGLSEENRKKIDEIDSEEFKIRKEQVNKERKQFVELLDKGTGQIIGVRSYYERISKSAIKHATNDQQKVHIQTRSDRNIQNFNRLITVNTPENNIALWKIYEPIVNKIWATHIDSEVTPEQLSAIETSLIDPLINALEKDVAALPASTSQRMIK